MTTATEETTTMTTKTKFAIDPWEWYKSELRNETFTIDWRLEIAYYSTYGEEEK